MEERVVAAPNAVGQILVYMSAEELLRLRPDADALRREVAQLPMENLIRVCSFLLYVLSEGERFGIDPQRFAIETFVPEPLQRDLLAQYERRGDLFIFQDQLLGLIRLSILHAEQVEAAGIDIEQYRAFFRALMRYGDLHTAEFITHGSEEENAAANVMRGLAVSSGSPPGNILARGYAHWLALPAELAGSPFYMDLDAEFRHATGGCDLAAYLATEMTLRAHAEEFPFGDPRKFANWEFDAGSWLRSTSDPERFIRCVECLAGTREQLAADLRAMKTPPVYHGLAMRPFRSRPVFRRGDGRIVLMSTRFLLEGTTSAIYWRLHDHLRDAHGDALRQKFTQFYGAIFERYVLELLRSVFDKGEKRVFAEAEAQPPVGAADAAIFLPDRVLLVDATKTYLRYDQTLLAGDLIAYKADIARTADKARQVRNAADAFRAGAVRYAGHDTDADRALPVDRLVILPEPIPRYPFLNGITRDALVAAGVEPEAWIISIGEVEEAVDRSDPDRLLRLLREWSAHPDLAETSFHNFLYFTGTATPAAERTDYIRANIEALRRRILAELKIKPA
jgi:hypothetical protein